MHDMRALVKAKRGFPRSDREERVIGWSGVAAFIKPILFSFGCLAIGGLIFIESPEIYADRVISCEVKSSDLIIL